MFNIDECILYRNFQQGDILEDMSRALEICCLEPEEPGKSKSLFYSCMNRLVEMASTYGFTGNLWHSYLTYLLANHENAFSTACEITDLYRRYQTYVRCYDKNAPVFKICGGANADDYEWTDVVLRECFRSPAPPQAHGFMDGLSVHYYVGVEKGEHKGSATEFDEARWFDTLSHAVKMEELINRHGAIMDRYDPEKKIGMIVDEWGCWHDVEPGTNPGFLYQQNTMRDALTAGITLNIFNRHCDRVKMACIAQMVNVLQAVILTEGPRMVKTPTWYVFHMYRHHQGAQLVESFLEGVEKIGMKEEEMVPNVQESVSVDEEGVITITLNNLSLTQEQEMEIVLEEKTCEKVEATLLCGGMRDYNTFDMPERVKEECFKDYQRTERGLRLRLPACSVLLLRIG